MIDIANKNLIELKKEELKSIQGGWWRVVVGAIWLEIRDAWNDGGKAILEAYNAGYNAGYGEK